MLNDLLEWWNILIQVEKKLFQNNIKNSSWNIAAETIVYDNSQSDEMTY